MIGLIRIIKNLSKDTEYKIRYDVQCQFGHRPTSTFLLYFTEGIEVSKKTLYVIREKGDRLLDHDIHISHYFISWIVLSLDKKAQKIAKKSILVFIIKF